MIITKVRLQEEYPMSSTTPPKVYPLPTCDLNLDSSAGENGYILKVADGLGPPDFKGIVEGFDVSGIPVLSSDPRTRDIALRIGFRPGIGQYYGELRDDLYKLISRTVIVKVMNGSNVIAQTTGFIKQFDSVLFSNLPEVQMIIECQEGALVAPQSIGIPLATLNTLNPIINYEEGTAPTGLDIQFTVTAAHTGFTISEYSKFWAVGGAAVHNIFTVNYPFLVGDVVNLSTYGRAKKITRTRAAAVLDIAGYLNAGAVWPKLFSGVNAFDWTLANSWMTLNSARYTPRYWGV